MNNNSGRRGWAEIGSLTLLFVLILLFCLPLLLGWERMFFDDIAFLFYPQQVFLSRCLVKGLIPRWDPHICAGATPFYTRPFQSSLYPLNWLFLRLGKLNPGRDYFWLVRAPLALHYLLAAFFSFLFARVGLRLNRAGSFILSIAYTLSPTMIYMSTYPPEVFVQSWLPLFCLCLTMFYRNGRPRWLLGGGLAFAFASPSGDAPFAFHVLLIAGSFSAGLLVLAAVRREGKRTLRVIGGILAIFGIGFLLAGFYWGNVTEALSLMRGRAEEEAIKLLTIRQSLHPLYLVTLLMPDFFGGITGRHAWGAAYNIHCSLNDANLSGGLACLSLVFLGFFLVRQGRGRRSEEPGLREWWWIFFAIFILSLLVVLGAYTPFHRILRSLVPVFRMPYPIRFRSIECFALAGLLGTSATLLWERREKNSFTIVLAYLGVVGLAFIIALIWPYQFQGTRFSPGYRHLTALGDWHWFIRGPVLYAVIAGAIVLAGATFLKKRFFRVLITVIVCAEYLFFAYPALYRNTVLNRRLPEMTTRRFRDPSDHPVYQKIKEWHARTPDPEHFYRRSYYRSVLDNLAWIYGSLSALGFDIQPLAEHYRRAVSPLVTGFPYELRPKNWNSRFWENMSVRDVLTVPPSSPKHTMGPFVDLRLDEALPRFYFQDRWTGADDGKQLFSLLNYDLRDVGYCAEEVTDRLSRSGLADNPRSLSEREWRKHFYSLQRTNHVLGTDFSDPDRVSLEIDTVRPVMLVVTDVWHPAWEATDNGKPVPVHRVNYLQRGIWLEPGRHRIRMLFRPRSMYLGKWLSLAGLFIILIVILRRWTRFLKRNEGGTG